MNSLFKEIIFPVDFIHYIWFWSIFFSFFFLFFVYFIFAIAFHTCSCLFKEVHVSVTVNEQGGL